MKYKKIVMYIVFLQIVLSSCKEQVNNKYPEYFKKYNYVLELEENNQIESALIAFKEAEKIVDFIPAEHLIKAKDLSIKQGNCNEALKYLKKAMINGFDNEGIIYKDENCPEFEEVLFKKTRFDIEYKTIVDSIFNLDQSARDLMDDNVIVKTDSINMQIMLELINSKGFPNSQIIGHKSAGKAFLLILHFDHDIGNEKFTPIINDAFSRGWLLPQQYAWIIDRRRNWSQEKLPPYYYQLPTPEIFTMSEEQKTVINNRRDSIGLKHLSKMNIQKTENGKISIEF